MPETATRSTLASAFSAFLGVAAAMSCCLPTGALLASVGLAGASSFFERAQPFLIGLSILCLIWGFAAAARARSCPPRRRRLNLAVLTFSALVVVPVLVFPQLPARPPAGQPQLAKLDTERLREEFNQAANQRRVIAMFSPT